MNTQPKKFRTTVYTVDDLHAAKAWYSKAFDILPYLDTPFYVGFYISGFELGLREEKPKPPTASNALTYWPVDDISDAFDILSTLGAQELEAPNGVDGGIKMALLKDPWGNVFGLTYHPKLPEHITQG